MDDRDYEGVGGWWVCIKVHIWREYLITFGMTVSCHQLSLAGGGAGGVRDSDGGLLALRKDVLCGKM